MEEDVGQVTGKVLKLLLEMICLLTGETPPPVTSEGHVTIKVSPPPSVTPERKSKKMILQLTNQMIALLTGEEARMEDELGSPSPEKSSPLHSSQDSSQDGHMTPHQVQDEDHRSDVDEAAPEETDLGSDGRCMEEDVPPVIGEDGRYLSDEEEDPDTPLDGEIQEIDTKEESPEEILISPNIQSEAKPITPLSLDPSTEGRDDSMNCFPMIIRGPPHKVMCIKCGECFNKKKEFMAHRKVHLGVKLYSCSVCGKSFSYRHHLTVHERVHTGEDCYACITCGKVFLDEDTLLVHERIHMGDKDYSCHQCGKPFSSLSRLVAHERVHNGSKPFSCCVCGKRFSQRWTLSRHERVHTEEKSFSCSECGKCFFQKCDLVRHRRVHTGEKPYQCLECGKRFTQKTNLLVHERLHTGEKPFTCSVCGKNFLDRSALRRHEKAHEKDKA